MWKKSIQDAVSSASNANKVPVIVTRICKPKETISSTLFNYYA
jgi:hypothetical protein